MKPLLAYQQDIEHLLRQRCRFWMKSSLKPEDHEALEGIRRRFSLIRDEMLARPDLALYVCDKAVLFMARRRYGEMGNYLLGQRLQRKFPLGVSGGWFPCGEFYIHQSMLPGVLEYLATRTTELQINDTGPDVVVAGVRFIPPLG